MRFDALPAEAAPPAIHPPYRSSLRRAPLMAPLRVGAPVASAQPFAGPRGAAPDPALADLTAQGRGAPLGQKIVVTGRVTDEDGRPVRHALIEAWQCNAAGRYFHARDQHDAPLDPNFNGHGRLLTDADGRYRLVTIRPGAYPWGNHDKAWRPAHIHFSLFGNVFAQRLVTQMYFAGDPLLDFDPIFHSIADAAARGRLLARYSMEDTVGGEALGHVFDIVLRGRSATPFES